MTARGRWRCGRGGVQRQRFVHKRSPGAHSRRASSSASSLAAAATGDGHRWSDLIVALEKEGVVVVNGEPAPGRSSWLPRALTRAGETASRTASPLWCPVSSAFVTSEMAVGGEVVSTSTAGVGAPAQQHLLQAAAGPTSLNVTPLVALSSRALAALHGEWTTDAGVDACVASLRGVRVCASNDMLRESLFLGSSCAVEVPAPWESLHNDFRAMIAAAVVATVAAAVAAVVAASVAAAAPAAKAVCDIVLVRDGDMWVANLKEERPSSELSHPAPSRTSAREEFCEGGGSPFCHRFVNDNDDVLNLPAALMLFRTSPSNAKEAGRSIPPPSGTATAW